MNNATVIQYKMLYYRIIMMGRNLIFEGEPDNVIYMVGFGVSRSFAIRSYCVFSLTSQKFLCVCLSLNGRKQYHQFSVKKLIATHNLWIIDKRLIMTLLKMNNRIFVQIFRDSLPDS